MFQLNPKTLPESDIERMEMLLWKWKQAWQVRFDALQEKHGDEPFNVNGDDFLGDLRDWESYADENYQDLLPAL